MSYRKAIFFGVFYVRRFVSQNSANGYHPNIIYFDDEDQSDFTDFTNFTIPADSQVLIVSKAIIDVRKNNVHYVMSIGYHLSKMHEAPAKELRLVKKAMDGEYYGQNTIMEIL